MKLMNKIVCATVFACSMVFAADESVSLSPYAFRSVNLEFVNGENFPRPGRTTEDEDAVRAVVASYNAANAGSPTYQTFVLDDTLKEDGSYNRGAFWTHGMRVNMDNAYLLNISSDQKVVFNTGSQGNFVFGPNEYEQNILRAYAGHGMGTYVEGEGYKADPVGFVAGHLVFDSELELEARVPYIESALSLAHKLIALGKDLPRKMGKPRHFTLHYHPDDPMVKLLKTHFGFEVIHVGARDDYWLWNIPSATPVEEANNQHRRVMLLKKFPVVADASAAAEASA